MSTTNFIRNESFIMHDDVYNINGYEVIRFNGTNWLKIYHHNSKYGFFSSRSSANYSLEYHRFSLLSLIDDSFKIKTDNSEYFSLLMEYPQLNQYIQFRQNLFFTTDQNSVEGFMTVNKVGSWNQFAGIHYLEIKASNSLYVGCSNGYNNYYSIGTISTAKEGTYPDYFADCVLQITDLWIEIEDFSLINRFKPIFKCSKDLCYRFHFSFKNILVFILIYK